MKIKKVKNLKCNLSRREQEAMKYLTKRRNITITTTDKDAAVVILDTGNYIKEANCQIPNKTMTKHFKQTPLNNTVKW